MKVSKLEMIVTFLIVALVLAIVYSIYTYYIPIYFGSLLLIVTIVFLVGLIVVENELKNALDDLRSLASLMEQWIRNEDIRRDLEALPFFIEEKRREFIRGLKKGYDDITDITERLDRIRNEIERMQTSLTLLSGVNYILKENIKNINKNIFSKKSRIKINKIKRERPYNYWRIRRSKKGLNKL